MTVVARLATSAATVYPSSRDGHDLRVRIQVIDSGSGIPPEVRDRIFEPYFSTKKTGDSERGFGLGLAICRKIATLHGGTLTVASEVGRGTTFSLDLPTHPVARGDTEGLTEPRSKIA